MTPTPTEQRAISDCRHWFGVAALLTLSLCGKVLGLSEKDILFYAPFEGTTEASISGGNSKPAPQKPPQFAPGKQGQGYLSGTEGSELLYSTSGNTDSLAGTVALWVKPIGWSQRDPFMRFWFRVGEKADAGGKGEGSFLWLYKYLNYVPLYWLVQQQYRQRHAHYVGAEDAWRPNEWTHLAASWCGPVMRLYVNGKKVGMARTTTPMVLRVFSDQFIVGGTSWNTAGTVAKDPDCVLDEFYVFRRPLTEGELAALCEKGSLAFGDEPPPAEMDIRTAFLPSQDRLKVGIQVNGRRPEETQGLAVHFSIQDAPPKKKMSLKSPGERPIQGTFFEEEIDTRRLKPGTYQVTAALHSASQVLSQQQAAFEKPQRPEWLGNEIGVPKRVPPPWTPLVVEEGPRDHRTTDHGTTRPKKGPWDRRTVGPWDPKPKSQNLEGPQVHKTTRPQDHRTVRLHTGSSRSEAESDPHQPAETTDHPEGSGSPLTIACWGRTYAFKNSLFPDQITSQGQELLSRPIAVTAKQSNAVHSFSLAKIRRHKTSPLRSQFSVTGRLGILSAKAETWIEFDGFLWTRLTITGEADTALEGLELEIPLRSDVATLQHGALNNGLPANGKVAAWKQPITGQPFLWLGNEEVGLQWCLGNDYGFDLLDRGAQVELRPGIQEVVLIIRMVDHPVKLDRPLEYTFGLHPTPVKPLPEDWRSYDSGMNSWWRKSVGLGDPTVPSWAFWYQGWNAQNEASRKTGYLMGYQAPGPWTRQKIEKTVADQAVAFPYWNMQSVWRGAPDYRAFRNEWNSENPPPLPFETAAGNEQGTAWRTVPSFRDWAIWRYWKSLKENPWLAEGMGGFYNDVAQGFWGVEPRPGRDGEIFTGHELLGVRELQKRLYVAVTREWPQKVIANHQSGDSHLCQLAFAHAYVTGENYRDHGTLCRDAAYYQVMDLDSCRAELLSAHWGVPIIFLPEIPSASVPIQRVIGPEGVKPSEHLVGLLLLHDVIPWSTNAQPLPLVRLAAMKEAFGWDRQTEFVGYWKSAPLAKLESDRQPVVCSIFRRPGKVMFVVVNNSDEDANVTLVPDWQKLALRAPVELVDAYTATGIPDAPVDMKLLNEGKIGFTEPRTPLPLIKVPATGQEFRFPVSRRNFRALVTP